MGLWRSLLRREPGQVVLCDPLGGLAELQNHLWPWCEQQGITTQLQWWGQETSAALPDLRGIQWLIHGDTVRSEALLQANSAAAVRRNIVATQQLLASLPESGVILLLLSSHLAAERCGVAGATLAASEALVAQWAQPILHAPCRCGACPPRLIPTPPARPRPWPASLLLPGYVNGWLRIRSISFLVLLLL